MIEFKEYWINSSGSVYSFAGLHLFLGLLISSLLLGIESDRDNLHETLIIVEIVVLVKVTLWHSELEELSREALRVVVLLRHLDHEVLTLLVNLELGLVLSVGKLVDLHEGVLVSLDVNDFTLLGLDVHAQDERTADLGATLGLTSGEAQKLVLVDHSILDVHILNVNISLLQPLPLLLGLGGTDVTIVRADHHLEAVIGEVDLHEERENLVLVLHVDVLSDGVQIGKLTSLDPLLGREVVVVRHTGFVTTNQEDVGQLTVRLEKVDAGSAQLNTVGEIRLSDLLDIGNLAGADINVDDEATLNPDGFTHGENNEAVGTNLVDVVDEDLFVGLNLEVLVVTANLAEGHKLDELVATGAISGVELVMAIVQPEVLFEVNFACVSLGSSLKTVEHTRLDVQDVFGVAGRQLVVSLEHRRHDLVVELLGHEVHFELLLEGKVLTDGGHGTLGLNETIRNLSLHFVFY